MTASRIRRSRSLSAGNGISSKLRTTSGISQVGGEGVQTEPAIWCQHGTVGLSSYPLLGFPRVYYGLVTRFYDKPVRGAKSQVDRLGIAILIGQPLRAIDGIGPIAERGQPGGVRCLVPATGHAVELVRRGSEAGVRCTGPIRRVVARAMAGQREVRDFVVLEARGRRHVVRAEKFGGVDVIICWRHLATGDPVSEWGAVLH